MTDNTITFEIVEHITNLGEVNENGFCKELNLVRWNNGPEARFDIRNWDVKTHQRMSKGITLSESEMQTIVKALADRF